MEIRKCVACGKILKKQDVEDTCKKCTVLETQKKIEVEVITVSPNPKVEESQVAPQPESLIEASTKEHFQELVDEGEMNDDVLRIMALGQTPESILDPEVLETEIEPEHETKIVVEVPEVLPESQSKPEPVKVEEAPIKPGQAIRGKFMELVTEGKITEEYIFELSTKEGTAKFFGVRYPFLKEFNPNVSIKELTYINGHARYSSKPVTIGDRQYLITNDLYKATVPKFMKWTEILNKAESVGE